MYKKPDIQNWTVFVLLQTKDFSHL